MELFNIDKSVFHWEYTEEPHRSRRLEILSKHPEIKKFMKSDGDRRAALIGVAVLIIHLFMAYVNCILPGYLPLKFAYNVCLGSWFTSVLMIHAHEAAHGLIFGPNHIWKNRIYGLLLNIGIGLPFYSFFRKYHKKHHKFIGDEVLDAEYPTEFEAQYFPNNPLGKYIWLLAQPFIYAARTPAFIVKKYAWWWEWEEISNVIIVYVFYVPLAYSDYAHAYNYLSFSLLIASSTNMFGFWGVMSHMEFFKMKETTSYYGWLNMFYLNFGYHMEHHDFPNIPARYLPEVKRIAAEYYEDQFQMDSFHSAAVRFIFDNKFGIFSHLKRENATPWKYTPDPNVNFRKFTSG